MKNRFLIASMALSVSFPLVALAQWQGAPGSPPNNNTLGPVWVQTGAPVLQSGNTGINGDQYISSSKAMRVDGAGTSVLNLGNWYSQSAPSGGFMLGIYGHLNMFNAANSTTPPILNMTGLSRLNVYQICLTGDVCRTDWPVASGSGPWNVVGSEINYTAGNVGIGVVDPTQTLHVNGNEVLSTGAGSGFKFRKRGSVTSADDWAWYSDDVGGANTAHLWESGGGNLLNFTTGGFVGLGAATPRSRLHLANNTQSPPTGAADYDNFQILLWDTANAQTSYGMGIESNTMWFNTAADYRFYRNSAATPDMFIDDGNVGIGTATPNAPLHVFRNASLSAIIGSGATARNAQVNFNRGGTNNTYIGPSAANTFDVWTTENIGILFGQNNTERMRITTAGRVGIGTSSPNAHLHIANNGENGAEIHGGSYGAVIDGYYGAQINGLQSDALIVDAANAADRALLATTGNIELETGSVLIDVGDLTVGDDAYVTDRLGVGVAAPADKLQIQASTAGQSAINANTSGDGIAGEFNNTFAAGTARVTLGDTESNYTMYGNGPSGYLFETHVRGNVMMGRGDQGFGQTALQVNPLSGHNGLVINGSDNDGAIAGLKVVSSGQNMLIDGNEIDANATMHLQYNSANHLGIANGGGSVTIGTYISPTQKLHVVGNAYKTVGGTTWAASSDMRLKNVLGSYTYGLDEISKLNPIYFQWKKGNAKQLPENTTEIGFSAQEVEKIIPEAVSMDSDGYRQLHADPILWAMVNSIKELKAQNDELRARVEALEAR